MRAETRGIKRSEGRFVVPYQSGRTVKNWNFAPMSGISSRAGGTVDGGGIRLVQVDCTGSVSRTSSATIATMRLPHFPLVSDVLSVAIALSLCSLIASGEEPKNADWPVYLGGKDRSLYSPLRQIDRGNVAKLEVAWTYETGDKAEYQANNLIVDGGRSGRPSGGSLVAFALPR